MLPDNMLKSFRRYINIHVICGNRLFYKYILKELNLIDQNENDNIFKYVFSQEVI